ncbi:hypothetical protein IHC87_13750 [Photobacterium damselae subsp. damselae]|uniref:BamA/TamA family outer membrane protein n=1 Tax=Photobacterium damselae TaxID=38293 RepID=UPI001F3BF8A5|nr:BamA/TamA family outer membrane protein [Photobacterium damselae]UJZ93656.1 hypothetical protein IHC87_13750 [Photobacterium damselae subsp. damselae]UJZ97637.1 hypothetical protein IHC88_13720 [Photobacterium damselae subsp. damselae]
MRLMTSHISKAVAVATAFFCFPTVGAASGDDNQEDTNSSWYHDAAAVPFAFSTDSMGLSIGLAGVVKGAGQPQASLLGAGLVTNKGTWMTYLGAYNFAPSEQGRWLLGTELYSANYQDFDYFLGAGAGNDSSADDAVIADANEAWYQLSARYILPWGSAKQEPIKSALIPTRKITGHAPWNSGVSSIEFRPFYQSRQFEHSPSLPTTQFSTADSVWGLETRLDWDNQNNTRNPTEGSHTQVKLTYDPGASERPSWWKWELNQSWFWNLGQWGDLFDQQVIAFNVYTADTPSWNNRESASGQEQYQRPPEFAAVRLGGLYRLRSYQGGRFAGRSALSYSLEYRVMPEWQPLGGWPVFDWYDVPWWQWVAFVDAGRVADSYSLSTLHQDMKWSAGGAMRFQVEGVVVRAEMAWGQEESTFRVMVNQPF